MLQSTLEIQLIMATHSPLVMASLEPLFQESLDRILTLDLQDGELVAKETIDYKNGSANSWLTSDVFDLRRAYSLQAENALLRARSLQLQENPARVDVQDVTDELVRYLPAIDPFWPLWKYFAERHGVEL